MKSIYIKDDSCYSEIQIEGWCNEGRKINEEDYHNNTDISWRVWLSVGNKRKWQISQNMEWDVKLNKKLNKHP